MSQPRDINRDRSALTDLQVFRLRALFREILPANRFYARKFADAGVDTTTITSVNDLQRLPFTSKTELTADQVANPPYGSALTYPVAAYGRMHQTSGTAGPPLRWLDTSASWSAFCRSWAQMFDIVGLRPDDRLFFPFSFGPFLGFWTAFEAATALGHFCLPGGGLSTSARLRFLLDHAVTIVFCTPTYALRLAEVAALENIDLAKSPVRALIVAGEPGGSIPATRAAIEKAWGARVFDHSGLTEVGPMAIECPDNPAGLHLLECDYVGEVVDPATRQPVAPGEVGELVVTNLCRLGSPVIRYQTGDLVRVDPRPCACGRVLMRWAGGILGRVDDMIHVRGNNVYPSALEAAIRRFPEVSEFRIEVDRSGPLAELHVQVEGSGDLAERIGRALRDEFLFRADVTAVPPNSLPRFEMKARRIVQSRDTPVEPCLNLKELPS
jgi:phenylacetate-CoA ligase